MPVVRSSGDLSCLISMSRVGRGRDRFRRPGSGSHGVGLPLAVVALGERDCWANRLLVGSLTSWSQRAASHALEFSALPWFLGPRPAMITPPIRGLYVPNSRCSMRIEMHSRSGKAQALRIADWCVGRGVSAARRTALAPVPGSTGRCEREGLCGVASADDAEEAPGARRRIVRSEADNAAGVGRVRDWLRTAWWEVVGVVYPPIRSGGWTSHVPLFSERAEGETARVKVAEYFWRESGKWSQKQVPEDFGSLKFYDRWGRKLGFNPVVSVEVLDEMVG